MINTAKIYYHTPKIRKVTAKRDAANDADFNITRIKDELGGELPYERLREPAKAIVSSRTVSANECIVPEDSIFNCCANTLRSLGLTGKYDGFTYICLSVEAILTVADSPHFQSIYYDIGKSCNVSSSSVERSIRYAINYIKQSGNSSRLSTIFGDAISDTTIFSNSKFMTVLAADVFEKLASLEADKTV